MDNDIIKKLSKFALVSSVIGLCILGICPAFGIMGITIGIVFRQKGIALNEDCQKKIKRAQIIGIASLLLFVVDIVLALHFFG